MANKNNEETNIRIGKMLRKAREEKGLLQSDMCEATGLTKNHISAVERGISKPSVELLIGYCNQLHVTPNDILEYTSDDIPHELRTIIQTLDMQQQMRLVNIIKSIFE